MKNVRSFKKVVNEMNVGEKLWFNAIAATPAMVDFLREEIKAGNLVPNEDELNKMIVPSAIHKYMSGYSIAPQMEYIKVK